MLAVKGLWSLLKAYAAAMLATGRERYGEGNPVLRGGYHPVRAGKVLALHVQTGTARYLTLDVG